MSIFIHFQKLFVTFIVFAAVTLAAPTALAQEPDPDTPPQPAQDDPDTPPPQPAPDDPDTTPQPGRGGNYSTGEVSVDLINPIQVDSIQGLVLTILNILILVLAPIVVIFIILAGFKYVMAQGDPSKLEEAKRALIYAIIGGVLVVGATAIFEIIQNTILAF